MQKHEFSRYNDGVVKLYREKERRTDFSAKRNVSTVDDMEFLVKLDYEESAKREEDMEFAAQHNFSLSLKIRTRYRKGINNKCKAVIDGYLYDVFHVDKNRVEMWLYLEGVKPIDS